MISGSVNSTGFVTYVSTPGNSSVNIGTYSHAGAATDYSVVHLLINTIIT